MHTYAIIIKEFCAGIAQLAEQLICNQQVVGSIPIASSSEFFAVRCLSDGVFVFLQKNEEKKIIEEFQVSKKELMKYFSDNKIEKQN